MAIDPAREKRFVDEALSIVRRGEEEGILLRLLGATAVKLHCPKFGRLYEGMARALTDIDFVTYSKFNASMVKFFTSLGYQANERLIWLYGRQRHIYWCQEKGWQADIFFDELQMCHTVDFRGRLELDSPTITLADLVLEKMQIVKINVKDIKDVIILLREHEVGMSETETVNAAHIARVLSGDWGFYYTVTTNLNKTRDFLKEFEALTPEDREDVAQKIDRLLAAIEEAPKSLKWKLRARVGPRQKWYREVEEVSR
ncbi:MAG: hypothetical protein K6T75_07955 [Acetobacteraceae bacterium]|nr:hypothetical protein [Acetobacteraceae bacterium]